MKKLIVIFIMLILFGSAQAEQTKSHKFWFWTTKSTANGAFIAMTYSAVSGKESAFIVVAKAIKGKC